MLHRNNWCDGRYSGIIRVFVRRSAEYMLQKMLRNISAA